MKNVKILAVAAALSAVMTGSAFAAAKSGQELTITTAFNTAEVSNAVVQSKTVDLIQGQPLAANTELAKITNLPVGAMLVDASSATAGQIKFSMVGNTGATFQAVVTDGQNTLSANTEGSVGSDYNGHDEVTVKTAAEIVSPAAGVYTSKPVVYTYTN
ncbi:hypothetical protein CSK01_20275 [Salmonella enterica]|nr:hypothetical protein [Salmonella enterica]EBU1139985.1 hypothetical protein [Salmonella enterica]